MDGWLVRKSLGLRPQDQPPGEMRFGKIGIQIEGFLHGDLGVFSKRFALRL